jgi:integral membrane protein
MLRTPLARFRTVALAEGLSFLTLLFVAMPLKYLADLPLAVRIVGMAHGVLFVLYVLALAEAASDRRWPLTRVLAAFGASLVPFGNFLLERSLRREESPAGRPSSGGHPGAAGRQRPSV